VSKYNPDDPTADEQAVYEHTGNNNNNGGHFIFMDRNLGATFAGAGTGKGTGLFYQWGRKDPFPATGKAGDDQVLGKYTVEETTSTIGTIVYSISNPQIFIKKTTMGNWLTVTDDTLWGQDTAKTIYDPCPPGWRVPPSAGYTYDKTPWYGLVRTDIISNGLIFNNTFVFPLTGSLFYTQFNTGITDAGSKTRTWSAAKLQSQPGYYNVMGETWENHNYQSRPASDGNTLRCVKE
jgi:hypothetical protein